MRSVSSFAWLSIVSVLGACAPTGSSAYVSFNIPPDATCHYTPSTETATFVPVGQFDVGAGTTPGCSQSYYLHLQVDSTLKQNANPATGRAEPNVLQITSADVTLMDKNQGTLPFTCDGSDSKCAKGAPDASRPNPFRVETENTLFPSATTDPSVGIVAIEAIPKAYAAKLGGFDGDKILVQVQIYGTTTGDVDVDFKSFTYPVGICKGCLTLCSSKVGDGTDSRPTKSDLLGTNCDDNAGADGRWCIDGSC